MLPETMTVIETKGAGGPEVLMPGTRALPEPGPGEVLIEVAAAGINRPDVLQRQGLYPAPKGASDLLGLEVAGKIVKLGSGATRFKPGDAVCALVNGGGYADYVVAPEATTLPVPQGLSMIEAAALPETVFTVWHNVFERAALKPGEWLLVHGGTSGIGTTAIQIGAALGAKVMVTVGSAEKARAAEALGAVRAINYRDADFVEAVRETTAGHGADVILDMVGGDYIDRNLRAAAARWTDRADRLPQGFQGRDRSDAIDAAPVDADRLDAPRTDARGQGAHGQRRRGAHLAADRRRQAEAGDRFDLSAEGGCRSPPPHRCAGPYRQDRAGGEVRGRFSTPPGNPQLPKAAAALI